MEQVIIGVDPHKLSATIEVVDGNERLLGSGRFATDRAGYAAMRSYAKTPGPPLWNRLPRAVAGTGPGMDLILIPLVVTGALLMPLAVAWLEPKPERAPTHRAKARRAFPR